MLFTIVEDLKPSDGEAWDNYCEWRGIQFNRFDSIDGMLRPSVFEPITDDDWHHVVHENLMGNYITNLDYAIKKQREIETGIIIGFCIEEHEEENPGFLGYDIIDGYFGNSLLTNFGNDIEIINENLLPNALISCFLIAEEIHDHLLRNFPEDSHVTGSRILSIYNPQLFTIT